MIERPSPSQFEARSILSQTVQLEFLPPERFKGETLGQVVDIKKVGEVVAVTRQVEDHYEASIFDGRGNLTPIVLDVSSKDLVEANVDKQYVSITPTNKESTDTMPDVLFHRLGFPPQKAVQLAQQFMQKMQKYASTNQSDFITNDALRVMNIGYIQAGYWELGTAQLEDIAGKKFESFIFQVEHQGFAIDPRTPSDKKPITEVDVNEDSLNGGFSLRKGNTVFSIHSQTGEELASFTGINPVIDPADANRLVYINGGRIYELDITGVSNRSSMPKLDDQVKVSNAQELQIDPNGNFFIVRTNDNKLQIIDRDSGDVSATFENIQGPILVDKQGDILLVDGEGKLREIQTNFQAIPPGGDEKAKQRREEELRQMQERFANLELGKVERARAGGISEDAVAATLRENLSRQVTAQIAEATKPEVVEDVLDRLQALKGDPANQAYTEVIDEFVNQARERLSGIRTGEFDGQLSAFHQALDDVQSVGDTIGLDEQFGRLLELRQKIDVTDPQKRREIDQRLRMLQTKKDTLNNQYQGELVEAVTETFPEIEQLVRETGSQQELAYFSSSTQAQQFEMMLANIKDPEVRKGLRGRYVAVRAEQKIRLEESGRQMAEQDRQRWAQTVEEAREDLKSLQEQIAQLSDAKEIDRFGRHPLVTSWRSKLFALPPELREVEEKRLEIILGARKKDMEHRKELGAVGEAGELRFGNITFPIYKEPPRLWQPKFVPIKGSLPGWADLVFEDSQGRVWKPEGEQQTVVVADMNDERTKRMVEHYRIEADEYFKGIDRKVPDFDEHWRITDYHKVKLEELAEILNLQLAHHRGITILQGEAGTGKNVLIDILANLSNREVITVPCNENSVKEDLMYEFEYDPNEGTYKLPSNLIEGIQTPGAIILFDEINALKPGIAKMLNSLFDYRRRIYLTEGSGKGKGRIKREIIIDPTVILVGTMNPQNYAGVNRLSPEVKSRSRVIDIEYPPFEERRGGRTHYRSDEAEMLAAYMDDLSELKQKEFRQVWDYVINRDQSSGGDMIVQGNPQIETDIRRVYDVIRVANRLREVYSAYQQGDSNEPMDFPTSLREVTDIVMEMNHRQGVKPMVKRVIVPKIDDRRQKKMVEQTIDAVLPNS